MGAFFFNHGLNNWLPEILRRGGMTAAEAGLWAAIPTAMGVFSSLLIPRLATPARRKKILLALILGAGLATLLLQFTGHVVPLSLGLILQGVARGSMMTVMILSLVETTGVGSRHAGSAGGMFFSAAEIVTGGFSAGLYLLSGICGLLILLASRLRP